MYHPHWHINIQLKKKECHVSQSFNNCIEYLILLSYCSIFMEQRSTEFEMYTTSWSHSTQKFHFTAESCSRTLICAFIPIGCHPLNFFFFASEVLHQIMFHLIWFHFWLKCNLEGGGLSGCQGRKTQEIEKNPQARSLGNIATKKSLITRSKGHLFA